jgi:hypothetical protein
LGIGFRTPSNQLDVNPTTAHLFQVQRALPAEATSTTTTTTSSSSSLGGTNPTGSSCTSAVHARTPGPSQLCQQLLYGVLSLHVGLPHVPESQQQQQQQQYNVNKLKVQGTEQARRGAFI